MPLLFSRALLGPLTLQNHLVMCPLTRDRAIDNVPNELMAQYYAQRASVGLIITEGTSPSPNGLGYARIPGNIFGGAGGRMEARRRGRPREGREDLRATDALRAHCPSAQPSRRCARSSHPRR